MVNARPLNYDFLLDVREKGIKHNISFQFHLTGSYFIKDRKMYHIERKYQIAQARKANIGFRVNEDDVPLNKIK